MPNFEIYRPQPEPAPTPTLTITAREQIHLNGAAARALGRPFAVHLLYDPDSRIIGIRPHGSHQTDTFQVHALRCADGSHSIAAAPFLRHYRLTVDCDRTWPAVMDDGVLCADLRVAEVTA